MRQLTEQGWLHLLVALLLFGVVGVTYSLVVPPFETPDELYHYAFVRHLAAGNSLPVQDAANPGPWEQEGSQPPLYYQLAGWLTARIDQAAFDQPDQKRSVFEQTGLSRSANFPINRINNRSNIGDPLFPGNKNRMLYSAVARPLKGVNLAVHVARWFSLLLGMVTLVALYSTGRQTFPERPRVVLLALWIVATIPQFAFISASVSNDNMIIAVSSVAVYWLVRLAVRPADHPIHIWEWLVLGVLLGLAGLSKLQGLGLWLLAALVGLLLAWRRRDWRLPLVALLPVAVPALALCGWWYWRNYTLYGDWLGVSHLLAINGQRDSLPSWQTLIGEARGLRYSFWGLFGWFNILLPTFVYQVLDGVTLLAVLGLPLAWLRSPRTPALTRGRLVLLAWAVLSLLLIVYWSSQATGSQGRLLFPGMTAFGLLLAWGLSGWRPAIRRDDSKFGGLATVPLLLGALLPALLLGASVYTLTVLLPGAYRIAEPVAGVPASAQRVDIAYKNAATGDQIRLLALSVGSERYRVGEQVPVTLYLTTDALLHHDYQLFIQFLDEAGHAVANVTTHPGWGRNPTTLWTPGVIYGDEYLVQVKGPIDARAPLLAQVYVGFINPATEETTRLPVDAYDASGREIEPMVGQVALSPHHAPDVSALSLTATDIDFGDVIVLRGFRIDEQVAAETPTLPVTLLWEGKGAPTADYVAYVHLLNAVGDQVAGYDQAPAGTRFPTRYWQVGDVIVSEFSLALPGELAAGSYQLWVGLYDAASQGAERLPVMDAGERPSEHNQVWLGELQVAE